MALLLKFGFAAQVIAAFVIFVLGYIGLFALLMIGFVALRALYEGVKWIRAYAARQALASLASARLAAPSEGDEGTVRISFLFTPADKKGHPVDVAFQPVLTRRQVAGNYSLNHPGGTPR
jgi:hypothetical protein